MSRTILRAGPLCAAACILLLTSPFTRPASAQVEHEDERPEIKSVHLSGVHSVDEGLLKEGLATKASSCKNILFTPICLLTDHHWFNRKEYLDRDELERDMLRIRVFYYRRGYRATTVDTTVTPSHGGVSVRFTVSEGEPIRVSSISVRQPDPPVLSSETLDKLVELEAGNPLDLLALDTSVIQLQNALFNLGYADAEVMIDSILVHPTERAAAVRITVDPKYLTYVGDIDVSGTDHVSPTTVRKSLSLSPGDIFEREKLLESQRSLYESNMFRQAGITVAPGSDSIKDLVVSVREAPLSDMRLSAGFNTVDFLQAEQRFTRYDFLGGGRRVDLRLVLGNILARQLNGSFPFHDVTPGTLSDDEARRFLTINWQASAEFTQPWWQSPKNTIGLSMFAHRRTAPGIFIDRGYGASATFTRAIGNRSPLSVSYRYEITEVQAGDVYFCQNYGVCETSTINALRRRQALSPISISYFTDHSNDLFFPTHGYILRADVEHASTLTGSAFRYNRVSGELSHYWDAGNGAIAARVRAGFVKNLASTASGVGVSQDGGEIILHPRKRFYAGGSQSVRGYGENQLGPRVLTVSPQSLLAPRVNAAGDTVPGCTAASIADRTCDPAGVPASEFQPRPTGGTALIEANVEWRFRIWKELNGAIFLDGAFVGEGALRSVTKGTGALTPGFGFRYLSPAGMIRVDVGIRPTLVERLPVVTQVPDSSGNAKIVSLTQSFRYDPLEGSNSGLRRVFDRLALHLSIGQAF